MSRKNRATKKSLFLHPCFKAFWCRKASIFNNFLTILQALLHNFLKKRDPSNSPPLPTKSRVRCWNKPINTWLVYAFWAVFEPWRRARGRVQKNKPTEPKKGPSGTLGWIDLEPIWDPFFNVFSRVFLFRFLEPFGSQNGVKKRSKIEPNWSRNATFVRLRFRAVFPSFSGGFLIVFPGAGPLISLAGTAYSWVPAFFRKVWKIAKTAPTLMQNATKMHPQT